MQQQGAIDTAAELVERCRDSGVLVFHLATAYQPDLADVPPLVLARLQATQSSSAHGKLRIPNLGDDALLPAVTPAKVRPLMLPACSSAAVEPRYTGSVLSHRATACSIDQASTTAHCMTSSLHSACPIC